MNNEGLDQKPTPQKSKPLSNVHGKRARTPSHILAKLIYIVCISIIIFVGIDFSICQFRIPGTRVDKKSNIENIIDCQETKRRGNEVLLSVLTTLIALKTKMSDED